MKLAFVYDAAMKRYRYVNSLSEEFFLSLSDESERWDVVALVSDGNLNRMSGRDAALVILGEAKAEGITDTKKQLFFFDREVPKV